MASKRFLKIFQRSPASGYLANVVAKENKVLLPQDDVKATASTTSHAADDDTNAPGTGGHEHKYNSVSGDLSESQLLSDFSSTEIAPSKTTTSVVLASPRGGDSRTKDASLLPSSTTTTLTVLGLSDVSSVWSGLEREAELLGELEREEQIVERLVEKIREGPPARPSNVRLVGQSNVQKMHVYWDGPIWSVRVPVQTYSIEVLQGGSEHWLYLDTFRPSHASQPLCHYETDTLDAGTYMFRITPFNDVGAGPAAISEVAELKPI